MSFDPSVEPDLDHIVTTPTLPTDPGIVYSPKQFSDGLTLDLTDAEIQRAMEITLRIRRKWSAKFRSRFGTHGGFTFEDAAKMLNDFETEIKETMATEMDLMVSVDMEPVIMGEPPVITFEGALPSHSSAQYGLDHERKEWEVKRSKDLGQDFLGIDKIGE